MDFSDSRNHQSPSTPLQHTPIHQYNDLHNTDVVGWIPCQQGFNDQKYFGNSLAPGFNEPSPSFGRTGQIMDATWSDLASQAMYDNERWHTGQDSTEIVARNERTQKCLKCKAAPRNMKCYHQLVESTTPLTINTNDDQQLRPDYGRDFMDMSTWTSHLRSFANDSKNWSFSGHLMTYFADRLHYTTNKLYPLDVIATQGAHTGPSHQFNCNLPITGVNPQQLDMIIAYGVWGSYLWDAEKSDRKPGERLFWSLVQMITGYLFLLYNIPTIYVRSPRPLHPNERDSLAIKLFSTLCQRLQVYFRLLSLWCRRLEVPKTYDMDPAPILAGLEALYNSMTDTKSAHPWSPDVCHPSSDQHSLLQCLNQSTSAAIDLVWKSHMSLSDTYEKRHQMSRLPALVLFSRSPKTRKFPRHCCLVLKHNSQSPREVVSQTTSSNYTSRLFEGFLNSCFGTGMSQASPEAMSNDCLQPLISYDNTVIMDSSEPNLLRYGDNVRNFRAEIAEVGNRDIELDFSPQILQAFIDRPFSC